MRFSHVIRTGQSRASSRQRSIVSHYTTLSRSPLGSTLRLSSVSHRLFLPMIHTTPSLTPSSYRTSSSPLPLALLCLLPQVRPMDPIRRMDIRLLRPARLRPRPDLSHHTLVSRHPDFSGKHKSRELGYGTRSEGHPQERQGQGSDRGSG